MEDADHSFLTVTHFAKWAITYTTIAILAAFALAALTGCSTLGNKPPPPQGELCVHNKPRSRADCSTLPSGKPAPAVAIEKTDKWTMFSPTTWESVQNYIDALLRAIDEQDKDVIMVNDLKTGSAVMVSTEEIRSFLLRVRRVKAQAESQRRQ